MEREVARPGACVKLHERRIIRRKRTLAAVEVVDQQLIEPEVIDKSKLVIGRQIDGMSMRALLALGIGAMAGMLHESRCFAQFAAVINGKHGHASTGVVRDQ